ncbi:DUF6011 domain-containing protein [Streptomyces sp. SA15]|uniref:DUF6011 domain-containing protein n=1 Tax=Streptomyces sp. SA15 TaxID=934019 RepID=UPI0015CED257|nr:DUF6011 domain-containing protein [Streptomyces sp. SA15]
MSADRPKCLGRCGRRLTNPVSIARGYGKTCAERLGIDTSPPPTARTPTAAPVALHPGQTELPLQPFQPTLESL